MGTDILHIAKKAQVFGSWEMTLGPDERGFRWWRPWARLYQCDQTVHTNNVTHDANALGTLHSLTSVGLKAIAVVSCAVAAHHRD